jgi:NAD(P)H-nitrite reductase large subunit
MGKQAGRNMAGGRAEITDALAVMNAAEIAGVPMVSAGQVEAGKGCEVNVARGNDSLRRVVMLRDRVVGMSFVGDIRNAGVYVNMIRHQVPVAGDRERFLKGLATYADVAAGAAG